MPSRFTPSPEALAQNPSAQVCAQIQQKAGRVPSAYAALAALQPQSLQSVLTADASAAAGGLSFQEKEIIKLQVSALTGCEYCETAHYWIAKKSGLSEDNLRHIRQSQPTGLERQDALIALVHQLMREPGSVPDTLYQRLKNAGFDEGQLAEVALTISVIMFTNMFNRINDTTLDFPAIPA